MKSRYYEIDDTNTVRVFEKSVDENKDTKVVCVILQDVHPDGRSWESREEAQAWIDSTPYHLEVENTTEPVAE